MATTPAQLKRLQSDAAQALNVRDFYAVAVMRLREQLVEAEANLATADEDYRTKERAVDLAQAPVLRRVA
jgi:hypothetical protein